MHPCSECSIGTFYRPCGDEHAGLLAYFLIDTQFKTEIKIVGPTQTDKSYVQEIVKVEYDNENDDTRPVLLNQATVNINVSHFVNVFVIKQGAKIPIAERDLIMAMILCSINALTYLVACFAVLTNIVLLLTPFLVGHVVDIVFSVIYVVDVDLYGHDISHIKKLGGKDAVKCWYLDLQAWSVVAAIVTIFIKAYLVRVLWLALIYLHQERSRLAREERQQKWANNLLEANTVFETIPVDISPPPPAYEHATIDHNWKQPPTYFA